MSLFGGNYNNNPLVVNLSQNLKFHKNHHAGIFRDSHAVGDEVPRRIVEWEPKDAVDSEEAERMCRSSVRKDRIVEFAPGVIAPRGVIWLMPDKADQLPEQAKSHPQLGPFFNGWYRHQNVIKALKYKARTETEIMEKLKFTTKPTELDDEASKQMNRLMNMIEKHANKMDSGNGSDSES